MKIQEIEANLQVLKQYIKQKKQIGKDLNGRVYLTIQGPCLALTHKISWETSHEKIHRHLKIVSSSIHHIQDLPEKSAMERRFSKIFHLYIKQEVEDYSEAYEDSLQLKSFMGEIDSENPFYDTDLILFNEEYAGVLPLNGIKEKEFNEVTAIINDLKVSSRCRSIIIKSDYFVMEEEFLLGYPTEEQQAWFKNEVMNAIVKLCTRAIGRCIVKGLIEQPQLIFLMGKEDAAKTVVKSDLKCVVIHVNPAAHYQAPAMHGSGDAELPFYIVLGHEMIHALNHTRDLLAVYLHEMKIEGISHAEEQKTILGRSLPKYNTKLKICR